MLCDDLDEQDGTGGGWCRREVQERGNICMHIADSLRVQQKLTQHCKAIIVQF